MAYSKIYSFPLALASKVHNLPSDSLKVALCAAANAPLATNTKLSDLTEIAYTNCSSRAISTTSCTQTLGILKLLIAQLTLTASGGTLGPFRYAVVYNDTATNRELLDWFDYGSDLTLNNGESVLLPFDQTSGLFQLG